METYGYNHPQSSQNQSNYRSEKKLAAGLLGLLLSPFAANKFYLGYIKEGIIQVILNICTCGVATVIPFIEGIIYLTMSDEQFDRTYVQNKKPWF
ncbi:TM2 domain-containing protein [Chryseobacterium sp. MDT2-18]|uniref:TM2 domain-containing protein n=1 Tax=Chryseobacterium sp. MDT2-18 TaxID=1259136 RepID=UPI002781BCC2|nr:TM2 domain-containing protein [Chryseobacterium sp. MDT2-18]MDQ0477543.1 TM2 domain-containing membrane protein YozV [Chryseobacterium sp. MDT2-18]